MVSLSAQTLSTLGVSGATSLTPYTFWQFEHSNNLVALPHHGTGFEVDICVVCCQINQLSSFCFRLCFCVVPHIHMRRIINWAGEFQSLFLMHIGKQLLMIQLQIKSLQANDKWFWFYFIAQPNIVLGSLNCALLAHQYESICLLMTGLIITKRLSHMAQKNSNARWAIFPN